jgi:hypothetical protein
MILIDYYGPGCLSQQLISIYPIIPRELSPNGKQGLGMLGVLLKQANIIIQMRTHLFYSILHHGIRESNGWNGCKL